MQQKQQKKRAGKLYLEAAGLILYYVHPEMPSRRRENILRARCYDQMESLTGVGDYILAAVDAVKSELDDSGIFLPGNINHVACFDDDPDVALEESRILCDIARFTENEKARLALKAARAVHNLWVINSAGRFGKNPNELHCFMPLELIGYARVEFIIDTFVEPLLATLNLATDSSEVEYVYEILQREFLEQNDIKDEKTLCQAIPELDYYVLSPYIRDMFKEDKILVKNVAVQIIEHNWFDF